MSSGHYVINVKRILGKDGKVLPHPEWQYLMISKTFGPSFFIESYAKHFSTRIEAQSYFIKNRSIIMKMLEKGYDLETLGIRKLSYSLVQRLK